MKRKSCKESENDPQFIPGRILEMHQQGISERQISEALEISRSKVHRRLQSYFQRGTMTRKKGSGRPRLTDERTDRTILREVKIDPFITCCEILVKNPELHVSPDTIRRRIIESGEFKSYWAAKKPYLSQEHIRRRLQWCTEHVTWSDDQWRQVLFSDESPYVLRYSGSQRVWRRHNERYILKNTKAVIKHDIKIMVWGCFSYHGLEDCII
jgi:transposase